MSINIFDKDVMLDALVSLEITKYNLASIFDDTPDLTLQEEVLLRSLKSMGCTLKEIDDAIRVKDFTHQLTDQGSGPRERRFVMEWIKERYEEL